MASSALLPGHSRAADKSVAAASTVNEVSVSASSGPATLESAERLKGFELTRILSGSGLAAAIAPWDMAVAKTGLASVEGVTSVAAGFSARTTKGGQAVGNWIGNTFCPR